MLRVIVKRACQDVDKNDDETRALDFDASKAFDTICHASIFHKLKRYGFSYRIYVCVYLLHRTKKVVLNGYPLDIFCH